MKKIIHQDDCWIWSGCVNSDGYPKITRNGNSNIKDHRYVYQQVKGGIPEGYVVRHTCDNILCLNPDHLIIGTPTDNMRDRQERGRTNKFVSDEINQRIVRLRNAGLSQQCVAGILGCSQGHISKVETGKYSLLNV